MKLKDFERLNNGDKITFKKNLIVGGVYDGYYFYPQMPINIGLTTTIAYKTDRSFTITNPDDLGYSYPFCVLERSFKFGK